MTQGNSTKPPKKSSGLVSGGLALGLLITLEVHNQRYDYTRAHEDGARSISRADWLLGSTELTLFPDGKISITRRPFLRQTQFYFYSSDGKIDSAIIDGQFIQSRENHPDIYAYGEELFREEIRNAGIVLSDQDSYLATR